MSRILQEHARAGHFKEIILVHTDLLEDISNNLQIERYHEILNENLAHLIWAKEKIESSKPVLGNLTECADSATIVTVGVADERGHERLLYPIEYPREKQYAFVVDEKLLKEDGQKIISEVRKTIGTKKKHDGEKISFGIYPSEADESSCYTIYRSSVNQELIQYFTEEEKQNLEKKNV